MRRKASFVGGLAVLAVGAALASCGPSGGASSTPGPCGTPVGVQVALIYPAPGSTGVPDAFAQVIVAASGSLPVTYDVAVLVPSAGYAYFGNVLTPVATPFPSPAATPPFANPTYYTSTNGGYTFASGVTLTAQINDTSSTCTPGTSLGSFTTQ